MKRRGFIASLLTAAVTPWRSLEAVARPKPAAGVKRPRINMHGPSQWKNYVCRYEDVPRNELLARIRKAHAELRADERLFLETTITIPSTHHFARLTWEKKP